MQYLLQGTCREKGILEHGPDQRKLIVKELKKVNSFLTFSNKFLKG